MRCLWHRESFVRLALRGIIIRASPLAEYGEIIRELYHIGNNVHPLLLKAPLEFVDEIMLQKSIDAQHHLDSMFTDPFV